MTEDADADEVMYVVLQRHRHTAHWVPGSKVVVANCGHRAAIAPTGQAYLASADGAGAYTLCTDCMTADALFDDALVDERRSIPGAMAELESLLPPGAVDQISAFMRDHGIKRQ